ncbi:MAG TPA: SpoIID/LytB domain-containing protein [Gammaproteobacteria bacterium]|nr:SpoIID/LytB domain-containing protein [Gammaproteobacteria bacterium]
MIPLKNLFCRTLILQFFLLCISCPAYSALPGHVRVRILERHNPDTLQIKHIENTGIIVDIDKNSVFPVHISPSENYQIMLPGTEIKRIYAGSIRIDKPGKQLRIINTVPFEEYVKSVVLSEMGLKLSEAMQAQSILTRTWAATHLRPEKEYDFNHLTNSQVYKGIFSTVATKDNLLLPAFGKVLTYDRKLIEVFYHAECAERGFSPYEIWGSNTFKYYKRDKYPKVIQERVSHWRATLPVEKVNHIFDTSIKGKKNTTYIKITQQGKQGIAVNSHWYGIDTFRIKINRVLGWNKLRSNSFTLKQEDEYLIFEGSGFGHLVGMCQKNAVDLAKLGWSYKKILSIFYPGAEITNRY